MILGTQAIMYNSVLSKLILPKDSEYNNYTNITEMLMGVTSRPDGIISDRSGTFTGKYKVKTSPIPTIPTSFNKTFETICAERAAQLIGTGKNLLISWSGGIDSTCVLVNMINAATNKDQIKVVLGSRSITENQSFYDNHIKDKLNCEIVDGFWADAFRPTTDELLVTGDNIGQIFGMSATSFMENKYDNWQDHVATKYSGAKLDFFMEKSAPFLAKCPFEVVTIFDLYWWITFNIRWTHSQVRMLRFTDSYTKEQFERNVSFFSSDDFQIWSMINHDLKLQNTPQSYKSVMKDIIWDFDKNDTYYDNKVSEPSSGPSQSGDETINSRTIIANKVENNQLPVLIDDNFNRFFKEDILADKNKFKPFLNLYNGDNLLSDAELTSGEWFDESGST